MTDSNVHDRLDAKHKRGRERRIEAVKRWVEYIESTPPEKWGSQQNVIVNEQLDAAQSVGTSAAHKQHVENVAREIMEERGKSLDTSSDEGRNRNR